jgi:bleomycin hydrolase
MKPIYNLSLVIIFVNFLFTASFAQKTKINDYEFTIEKLLQTTPVKNQSNSSTCWSFATTSFIETELIRMGKGEYDLSEMFIVHNTYPRKAEKYIRMQGYDFFTPGGQAHDVMATIKKYGLIPENIYSGLINNASNHNHAALDKALKFIVDTTRSKNGGGVSPNWLNAVNIVLDTFLGKTPGNFKYKRKAIHLCVFMNCLKFNKISLVCSNYKHWYLYLCLLSLLFFSRSFPFQEVG